VSVFDLDGVISPGLQPAERELTLFIADRLAQTPIPQVGTRI